MNSLIMADADNRKRALALESFIVEAPAGAGKTELLTQRYLKLLATVDCPEEIIALTFTNKAATEMRNRILSALEDAQNNTAVDAKHKQTTRDLAIAALQHAQNLGWQLLSQPARLTIQTMDALCSSLARQMPLLSRFGGQPKIADDASKHYQHAAQQTLAQIAFETGANDTVSTALRFMHNDIEKLNALLANMLAKRDQWQPLVGIHANISVEEIAQSVALALNALIEQQLNLSLHALPASYQTKLMAVIRFAASNLEPDHSLNILLDWQIPLQARVEDLDKWQALSSFLLTDSGECRKIAGLNKNYGFPAKHADKDTFKQLFEATIQLIADPQALFTVRNLPAVNQTDITRDSVIVKALAQLLQLASAYLWTTFQAANEVDFVAIAQSASYALENEKGHTDLALKLDYKISHLLVDEFQDTSPTQMRLITQLIQGWMPEDNRTLFCVGDPMQSIYRFRKADVSLFLAATQFGIGQLPLIPLKLTRNNRSHPKIIDWINSTFQSIFPSADNITQAAISYRQFIATKDTVEDEGVVIHPLVIDSEEDSEQAKLSEAHYVADLIEQEKTKNPNQKMAVLVRSRAHLRELVSVIRRYYPQLQFQAVEIESLNNRQTVLDALSLTRALLHRADRVHWLSILRAPWCGLTLADLHKLAGNNHHSTIWQLMQDEARLKALSIDGQKRLKHVYLVLQEAFDHQGRMPLRRWCESTWLKLGGTQTLISAGDNRDVQAFFDLVEKLGNGFSLDFNQLDSGMQKLYAQPDITADDSLQFLTIHKSKGLEFDTVILPALNRKPRHSDAPLMLWEEVLIHQQLQLIAAPYSKAAYSSEKNSKLNKPTMYDFLKDLETIRSDNETARLLYVAATRAIRKLHLVATVKHNTSNDLKPTAKSLLALLWPKLQAQFSLTTPIINAQKDAVSLIDFTPQLMRLKTVGVPDLLNQHNNSVTSQGMPNTSQLLPQNTLNLAADTGSLAHLYMEIIANTGLEKWSVSRINTCIPAMRQWLIQKGHAVKEVDSQITILTKALAVSITSQQGIWLLLPRLSRQTELCISTINDQNEVQEHRIDLTFIDDDAITQKKVRWIIDYKLTNYDESVDLKNATNQFQLQLTRYAKLFEHEGLPIKKALFFLNVGKLIEL